MAKVVPISIDINKGKHFKNSKIWYLSIESKIESQFIDTLVEKLNDR